MRGRPDDLFDKFLHLSSSFPESACVWPTQLFSASFTALVKELMYWVLIGGFQIPLLMNMDTKSKQLAAF